MNTPLYPSTSLETKWAQDKSAQLSSKIRQIIWIIAAYKKEWIDTINRVAFDYTQAVEESGGIPIIIPCNIKNIDPYLDMVDGIVFSGWWDVDPILYGEVNTYSEILYGKTMNSSCKYSESAWIARKKSSQYANECRCSMYSNEVPSYKTSKMHDCTISMNDSMKV